MSCKICGCKLHPCRCDFDNEVDFIKYGECFFELEVESMFAYECPKCKQPMLPHDGPWSIYHCIPCNKSVDLYNDPEPNKILVDIAPEPYNPHRTAMVIRLNQDPPIKPKKKFIVVSLLSSLLKKLKHRLY